MSKQGNMFPKVILLLSIASNFYFIEFLNAHKLTFGICKTDDVLTSSLGGTILDCVSTCIRTSLCFAFNYIQSLQLCEALAVPGIGTHGIGHWISNQSCIFSNISNWPKEIGGSCANHNCRDGEICNAHTAECQVGYCSENSSWTNAHLLENGQFHRNLGSRLRYGCNFGYLMVGEPFVECKVDEYGNSTRIASFVCYEDNCPYERGFVSETHLSICIKLLTNSVTAEDAMQACNAENAETMRIESVDVQNYVEKYLTRQFDSNPSITTDIDFIFIQGKSPESSNGVWNYEDGTQITYTNWMSDQPDLSANTNYLALRRSDNYKWHDMGPTQFRGYPLCQIKIGP